MERSRESGTGAAADRLVLPSVGVAVAGLLWGLFWMPFRAAQRAGVEGGWSSVTLFACTTLLLLPVALVRWRRLRAEADALLLTGLLFGAAFSLYSTALLLTQVVHAVLLFYLTPVWSTILGRLLLREPVTPNRALALLLGIGGLAAILGLQAGFPLPRNAGDWMALAAGVAWSYASLRIYSKRGAGHFETVFMFAVGGLLVTSLTVFLPVHGMGMAPSGQALVSALPWLLLTAAVFTLPPVFITVWGAGLLSPGRVGILLMGEVLTGVVSAALFSGEPFGARELAGSLLIVSAAVVEVMQRRPAAEQGAADCAGG